MCERIGEEIQREDLAMVAGVVCERIEELEEAKVVLLDAGSL